MEEIEIPNRLKTDLGVARYNKNIKRYQIVYKGKKVYLHKAVYLESFGEIPRNYVIHHLDGNRFNNKANNLVALSKYEHQKIHAHEKDKEYRYKVVRKIKRECVFEFRTTPLMEEFKMKIVKERIKTLSNILEALEDEEEEVVENKLEVSDIAWIRFEDPMTFWKLMNLMHTMSDLGSRKTQL